MAARGTRYRSAVTNTTRRSTPAAAAPASTPLTAPSPSHGPTTGSIPEDPGRAWTITLDAERDEDEEPEPAAGDLRGGDDGDLRRRLRSKFRPPGRLARWWGSTAAFDVAVGLVYLAFAAWLTGGLWPHPSTRAIGVNPQDQTLIEWFLAHGVLVWKGDFSLITYRLNSPDGVNLMSNASHLLHGVIMAPVTVLFGAPVSFALLVALNLAGTAAGWYLLLARGLRLRRWAALIGGVVTGFAPGMISQSNAHLHMTAQWLVPPIIWFVIRMVRAADRRTIVTSGVWLGLLVAAQLLLGEEVLFLTALTAAIYFGVYALARRHWVRQVAPRVFSGIGVALLVAVPLMAYPVWMQFAGPMHTPNAPFAPASFYEDLGSFTPFSPLSLAGSAKSGTLASSATEYNAFLGVPLLLVVAACVVFGLVWYRRNVAVVVSCLVTGLLMAYLSLGPDVTLNGVRTHFFSLYNQISRVPVISAALPTRYALALIPLIGVLLAYTLDATAEIGGFLSGTAAVLAVAALAPAMPAQLVTSAREPVPAFITSGAWRQCAPEGGVIVPVPLPTPKQPDAMRWPAAADIAFGIPEGFFIAPYGDKGRSSIGIFPRPTSQLLATVAKTGQVPLINDDNRAMARIDLAYWKANCVALAPGPNEAALRTTLEQLLGPGTSIMDTWTWKVS
jgi:hypothetical protein